MARLGAGGAVGAGFTINLPETTSNLTKSALLGEAGEEDDLGLQINNEP